jgi:hypothetical protein
MAKVELPSGAWVEYREELKAGDLFATQAAAGDAIGVDADGNPKIAILDFAMRTRNALLVRIITAWSYGHPAPMNNDFVADKTDYIGNIMSVKDYNALSKAIQPLLDELNGTDKEVEDPKKPSKNSPK